MHIPQRMHSGWFGVFVTSTSILQALAHFPQKTHLCPSAKGDSKTENSGDTAQTEEAAATHKSLMDRENEILSENTELWEKVFLAADKGMAMIEDGKNYGDFLLDTIESAKDQFSDEEYALLKKSAQEISEIEDKLTELEKQVEKAVDDLVEFIEHDLGSY